MLNLIVFIAIWREQQTVIMNAVSFTGALGFLPLHIQVLINRPTDHDNNCQKVGIKTEHRLAIIYKNLHPVFSQVSCKLVNINRLCKTATAILYIRCSKILCHVPSTHYISVWPFYSTVSSQIHLQTSVRMPDSRVWWHMPQKNTTSTPLHWLIVCQMANKKCPSLRSGFSTAN